MVASVIRQLSTVLQSIKEADRPELWPEAIEWDDENIRHATAHGVSADEIDQVIANGPRYRRNKRGRSADYLASGVTDGGRRIVVAVKWRPAVRRVRPVTAWEE